MNKTPYFTESNTQTTVRQTIIFCTMQKRKDAQDTESTRRQKASHLVGTPNGESFPQTGRLRSLTWRWEEKRGKIPWCVNWNTHPVLPANSVVWVHSPCPVQESLRHRLEQTWVGSAPQWLAEETQTTSGRTQLSSSNSWHTRYIPNLMMLKCGKYIIWNQWNMVADK